MTQIDQGNTITGYGEGKHISLSVKNKDFNEDDVQDHSLHQHPHEGHQEEVVEEDSYDLAVDGDMVTCCLINTSHKDELSYPEADAEVDVDVVTHVVE